MQPHRSKDREDYKRVLGSFHDILDRDGKKTRKDKINLEEDMYLKKVIQKFKVEKLKNMFITKIKRNNPYSPPVEFVLRSREQINSERTIQLQGFQINETMISVIIALDIIMTILSFYLGTFEGFFEDFRVEEEKSARVVALKIVMIIVFLAKVIVTSISVDIISGVEVTYITDLVWNYISSFIIFIDLALIMLNLVSLLVEPSETIGIIVFVVSLLKILTILRGLRYLETIYINSFNKEQYWNLIKVFFFNILFAHFLVSLLMAMSKIDRINNWLTKFQIENERWYVQYIWGYYWATTIMMTVGFGDILPNTFREAIIVAFLELFSCIILAYNISEIGNIISEIRNSQADLNRKLAIFKRMAKEDKIPLGLQRRIEAYLKESAAILEKFEYKQQAELLEEIPEHLRYNYIIESNKTIFPTLPFFHNLQNKTLINFAEAFEGKMFYPTEHLTKKDSGEREIMILKNGKVGFAYKKTGSFLNGTLIQEIEVVDDENPLLLTTAFLSRGKRINNFNIIAIEYSFIYNLQFSKFFSILRESEIDSGHFFMIRDKQELFPNEWEVVKCQNCSNEYHTLFDCPRIHYIPFSSVVIERNFYSTGHSQKRITTFVREEPVEYYTSCLKLRKKLFIPYERSRNIGISVEDSVQGFLGSIMSHNKSAEFGNETQLLRNAKKDSPFELTYIRELEGIVEKVVRTIVDEALTGYRSVFWDLEMDQLHDFANYFPQFNPEKLLLVSLERKRKVARAATIMPEDGDQGGLLINFSLGHIE